MDYIIRKLNDNEFPLLDRFLYEAIYIPEGVSAPDFSIIKQPDLQVYVKNFGNSKSDLALAAEVNQKAVGIVWTRIMNDYGHINDQMPSLAISLLPEFRNNGIGTNLMKQMFSHLKENGFNSVSLSVQKENYALSMYEKLGFEKFRETEEEYIMVKNLLNS